MTDKYILNDKGNPVPEPDIEKWAKWFEDSCRPFKRRVKREKVGPYEVSTVFLGLNHNCVKGPPILWETMVFGGRVKLPLLNKMVRKALDMDRCSGSREQAEAMHKQMVKKVKASLWKKAKV